MAGYGATIALRGPFSYGNTDQTERKARPILEVLRGRDEKPVTRLGSSGLRAESLPELLSLFR